MKLLPNSSVPRMLPVLALGALFCLGTTLTRAQNSTAKIVRLTPGTCAQVSDGDVLTLEWNPSFNQPSTISGLRDFSLSFARDEELATSNHRAPSLNLEAAPPTLRGAAADQVIAPIGNGFFQIRFHVSTRGLTSGTYRLVAAMALPTLAPDYQGEPPHMLNTPLSSSFCLEVTGSPDSGTRHQ